MPWFKVDDGFADHAKIRRLGKDKTAAVGLWTLCGSWSAANLADGFVPDEIIERYDPKHRTAGRLVAVGLWQRAERYGEHGYQFHEWHLYQPTRASIEAEREEWRAKKRRSRRKDQMSPGDTPGDATRDSPRESITEARESHGENPGRFPDPVPSRPVPSSVVTLAGGRSETYDRGQQPPPETIPSTRPAERCEQHHDHPDPPNCGRCADARRSAESWDAQQAKRRARIADEIEQARRNRSLECQHGTPGGLYERPDTGESLCPMCRRAAAS